MSQSILWRGIHARGHEACRLYQVDTEWRLGGPAAFLSDNRPCRLSYLIACESIWNTLTGTVSGWLGNDKVNVELSVDALHQGQMTGVMVPSVNGCLDLNMNFRPAPNLLPIRRL